MKTPESSRISKGARSKSEPRETLPKVLNLREEECPLISIFLRQCKGKMLSDITTGFQPPCRNEIVQNFKRHKTQGSRNFRLISKKLKAGNQKAVP